MDIKRIKQLAGLAPIVEAWDEGDFDRFMGGDDDEDLSSSEQELAAQADRDLRAKGIKVKNVDPEADMSALARTRAPEIDDEMDMAPASDEVDDLPQGPGSDPELGELEDTGEEPAGEIEGPAGEVDTPAEVQQAAAKVVSRSGVTQLASRLLANNPNATRAEFMAITRPLGISDHSANTMFYKIRNTMRAATGAPSVLAPEQPAAGAAMEFWVIKNASGKVLSESGSYDLPLWADYLDTKFDAKIFEKEVHAKKAVEALAKYGFTKVEVAKESVE
jgi:hypothetical protein